MNRQKFNSCIYGMILLLLSCPFVLQAQPFIDIAQIKYVNSPDAGLHQDKNIKNSFQYYDVQLNLPLIFKKDSSMLVFNPCLENWQIKMASQTDLPTDIHSISFPLYYIKPLSPKWSLTLTPIARWNGSGSALVKKEFFQMGGFAFASYKKRPGLEYRFGLYYNSEFSGPFFMPLAGIDWQINKRNNLFGVLPGGLTYEHKVSNHFFYGATFRAITNSYVAGFHSNTTNKKYLRIDENQLGLFADAYIAKNIVFTTEIGHSVLRKIRLGEILTKSPYYAAAKTRDNIYVSATLAYRMRFR